MADAIHGDVTQVMRNKTLDSFKKKNINILVATGRCSPRHWC